MQVSNRGEELFFEVTLWVKNKFHLHRIKNTLWRLCHNTVAAPCPQAVNKVGYDRVLAIYCKRVVISAS